MPNLRKLHSFKDAAKDIFSGDFMKDRENFWWDEAEEDVVRRKLKKISADSGVDMSSLFMSRGREDILQA